MTRSWLARSACAVALGLAIIAQGGDAAAQVSITVSVAPPPLPDYEQPVLVDEGSVWAPGYWDYGQDGYFWVPGTWVQPPETGLLWTPGYWAWDDSGYGWNPGYWGTSVGFYGGVYYGYGYSGQGYEGGHWQGEHFYYNTAISHVDAASIHNTYRQAIGGNTTINHTSYNGGAGGIATRPTRADEAAAHASHLPATAIQAQHRQAALSNPALAAAVNHGQPAIMATPRPAPPGTVHAADLPAIAHQPVRASGNAQRDATHQQEQDGLRDSQEKQRQELQQRQADEHAQASRQPAPAGNMLDLERQHTTQTQELSQRHAMEQKVLQDRQQGKPEAKRDEPRGR